LLVAISKPPEFPELQPQFTAVGMFVVGVEITLIDADAIRVILAGIDEPAALRADVTLAGRDSSDLSEVVAHGYDAALCSGGVGMKSSAVTKIPRVLAASRIFEA